MSLPKYLSYKTPPLSLSLSTILCSIEEPKTSVLFFCQFFIFMASSLFFFFISFTILMIMHVSLSSSEVLYLPLTHSLSKTQFTTTHHLLKSTSARSLARFHHHHQRRHQQQQVSLPLSPGSDYTLSFSLGSKPSQSISLYMDTGSDLVWFPCSPFECILCEGEYNTSTIKDTTFNLSSSSSITPVSCQSPSCSSAHSSLPNSDLCAISRCSLDSIETSDCSSYSCPPFYYAYADGSFVARLYHDKLSVSTSSPSLVLKNFTFGCAHTALAEPVGVAGFGRGVLSLPAQLASFSPQLGTQFSYCLVSHSFEADRVRRPSPLILGRHSVDEEEKAKRVENGGEFVYTAMLDNPKHPYFYSVGLEGVTVGGKKIPAPAAMKRVDRGGNGGMVVDSGTTYTMLPATFYNSVVDEFERRVGRVNKRASQVEDKTGLGPCYYFDDDESQNQKVAKVPAVVLHFVGNYSSVVLPRRNYFYDFFDGGDGVGKKRKVGCLMLMNGGDEAESSGPSATLGNYQQQGFEVVYDLEKRRIGFAKRKCALLWDSLNKR